MYFIFDCNGMIIGNPNGYKTMGSALTQQNRLGSKVSNAMFTAWREAIKGGIKPKFVCEIIFY